MSKPPNEDVEVENGEEIPFGSVEKIVGRLLEGVHDRDNVVRWTSAKGMARVAARLPLEMASEIVTALIESSFKANYSKPSFEFSKPSFEFSNPSFEFSNPSFEF